MKLYSSQVAPSPRKVLVFIAEKSIENIEVENLDIGKMDHKTPEYKKIAPNSRIPALVLDDGQNSRNYSDMQISRMPIPRTKLIWKKSNGDCRNRNVVLKSII